jgi:hypothetical protein
MIGNLHPSYDRLLSEFINASMNPNNLSNAIKMSLNQTINNQLELYGNDDQEAMCMAMLITHIPKYLQVGTYSVLTSRYLPLAKPSTYLVTTKLGRTQQYTLLIAITLAMSSVP